MVIVKKEKQATVVAPQRRTTPCYKVYMAVLSNTYYYKLEPNNYVVYRDSIRIVLVIT
jgi:hypothetical protein